MRITEERLKNIETLDDLLECVEAHYLSDIVFRQDPEKASEYRDIIRDHVESSEVYTLFNKEYLLEMFNTFEVTFNEHLDNVENVIIDEKTNRVVVSLKNGQNYSQDTVPLEKVISKYTSTPSEYYTIASYFLSKKEIYLNIQAHEALLNSLK